MNSKVFEKSAKFNGYIRNHHDNFKENSWHGTEDGIDC